MPIGVFMNMNDFFVAVKDAVQAKTSGTVVVKEVTKTNDLLLHVLMIQSEDSSICPCIYLDEYYDAYNHGVSIEDIAGEVLDLVSEHANPSGLSSYDFTLLHDFENVRDRLRFRVVNCGKNSDLLSMVPHVDFLDLARIYYIDMADLEKGATIKVNNGMLKVWGVSVDVLDEVAFNNTKCKIEYSVRPMSDVIHDMTGTDAVPACPFYVVTALDRCFGSSAICFDNLLQHFSDKVGSDIYIVPSSIHELLFLPVDAIPVEALRPMIHEVNGSKVKPEDFLSDNPYIYQRSDGSVQIA